MLRTTPTLLAVALFVATQIVSAQRPAASTRDLQGFWTSGTITPLQRPTDLIGKEVFSEAEAAEYEPTWLEGFRKNFGPDDLQAPDLDYPYMDRMKVLA